MWGVDIFAVSPLFQRTAVTIAETGREAQSDRETLPVRNLLSEESCTNMTRSQLLAHPQGKVGWPSSESVALVQKP